MIFVRDQPVDVSLLRCPQLRRRTRAGFAAGVEAGRQFAGQVTGNGSYSELR